MSIERRYLIPVLLIAVLLVVGPSMAVNAAASNHTATNQTGPPADQVFSVSQEVDAWERASLPLRTDKQSAAVSAPNADWRVRTTSGSEAGLNRGHYGIYGPGQQISFQFDVSDANANMSRFANQPVSLVAVQVLPARGDDVPDDFVGAAKLITDSPNANASYQIVTETQLNSAGDAQFNYTPSDSGQYFFVLMMPQDNSSGVSIAQNDLQILGNVTVLGADSALVQSQSPQVSAPDSEPVGERLDIEVNQSVVSANATHAVVIYDQSTYVNQSFIVELTRTPDSSFSLSNDSQLLDTIDSVVGTASVSADLSEIALDVQDNSVRRTADYRSLIDLVASEANTSENGTVLYASTNVTNGPAAGTVSVDTLSSWPAGDYQYTYIAVGSDSTQVAAASGTINLGGFGTSKLSAPANATRGDRITVSALVTNNGDEAKKKVVELRVNGSVVKSREVTLLARDSTEVSFTLNTGPLAPGSYTHGIFTPDDGETATLDILHPATYAVANITAPPQAEQGESINVTVNVTNTGGVAGTKTVLLRAGGTTLGSQTVPLDAGETRQVRFAVDTSSLAPGNYTQVVSSPDANQSTALRIVAPGPQQPVGPVTNLPRDPNGDGIYEDANGDRVVGLIDVAILYNNRNDASVTDNSQFYDFNGDGQFDLLDVTVFYQNVTAP